MSLTKRFFNAAKAELKSVIRNLTKTTPSLEDEMSLETSQQHEIKKQRVQAQISVENLPTDVCRSYDLVGLPIGAPIEEIQAAYRRQKKKMLSKPNTLTKQEQNDIEEAFKKLASHFGVSLGSEDAL